MTFRCSRYLISQGRGATGAQTGASHNQVQPSLQDVFAVGPAVWPATGYRRVPHPAGRLRVAFRCSRCPRRVHPRAGGAENHCRGSREILSGASPRVRGGLYRRRRGAPHRRFIPPRAGQTPWPIAGRALVFRFIPACAGRSGSRGSVHTLDCGASPRVRGSLLAACARRVWQGFIPRVCGALSGSFCLLDLDRVYPRYSGILCKLLILRALLFCH